MRIDNRARKEKSISFPEEHFRYEPGCWERKIFPTLIDEYWERAGKGQDERAIAGELYDLCGDWPLVNYVMDQGHSKRGLPGEAPKGRKKGVW